MRELKAQTSAETFQTELLPFTEAEVSDFSDPAGLIDLAEYVHAVPPSTVSLSNSPGCIPAGPIAQQSETSSLLSANDERPSSREQQARRDLRARSGSMRTVRVDAWAAPASASWGRSSRTTVRKVNSQRLRATSRASSARSTDWALPF